MKANYVVEMRRDSNQVDIRAISMGKIA